MGPDKPNRVSQRSCLDPGFRASRRRMSWIVVAVFLLAGCGGSGPSGQSAGSSPSPDQMTQRYVALVHRYWIAYKKAEGDIPSFADECGYYSVNVQPSACRPRIAAILPIHENFLADLNATPAPPQFAADDDAFRTHLPSAIAHLKAAMAEAETGNAQGVSAEIEAYVEAMIQIFSNLDHVDPSIPHD